MNMQTANVMAPPPPRTLEEMKLSTVMMRDIVLKTMFRKNVDMVSDLSKAVCLPIPVTQELVDMAREQRLLEATGTLNANNGNKMGYQLTEQGKARALDALAQSEYFGAMPVPLDVYREQVTRQSVRNMQITRGQLTGAMGHLVLPDMLLDQLGPAVSAGRSILMYGPPGNGKSSIPNGLCCPNGVRESLCESSVVAGEHEQFVPYDVQDQELAFVQHGAEAARFAIDLV